MRRHYFLPALFLLLATTALAQPAPRPQQYDVLIRNGRVIDGAGNPWVYADVGIQGDRIAFVGLLHCNAGDRFGNRSSQLSVLRVVRTMTKDVNPENSNF